MVSGALHYLVDDGSDRVNEQRNVVPSEQFPVCP